jgi:hypothetical protein
MRISELEEGFISSFKQGYQDAKSKSPRSSSKEVSKKSSPFDRFRKEDLRNLFKKIIKKEELDSREIQIAKELYREF